MWDEIHVTYGMWHLCVPRGGGAAVRFSYRRFLAGIISFWFSNNVPIVVSFFVKIVMFGLSIVDVLACRHSDAFYWLSRHVLTLNLSVHCCCCCCCCRSRSLFFVVNMLSEDGESLTFHHHPATVSVSGGTM